MTTVPPMRIAVLIASHNRRQLTERGLRSLLAQDCLGDLISELTIWPLDDGSSDGTADMARRMDPRIRVLQGDGQRYWAGGMGDAHRAARSAGADFYLWLNDDVALEPDALRRLLVARHELSTSGLDDPVVCGALRVPGTDRVLTGGMVNQRSWLFGSNDLLPPWSVPRECETMHGNVVLVSRTLLDALDPFDGTYLHGYADHDFSHRARRAGHSLWMAPGFVGAGDAVRRPHDDATVPLRDRMRDVANATRWRPADQWRFSRRNYGLRAPLIFLRPYVVTMVLGPKARLIRLRASWSRRRSDERT